MVNAKKKKASVREKTASAVKPAKRLKTSSSRVHAGRARFSGHRGLSDKDKKVLTKEVGCVNIIKRSRERVTKEAREASGEP